MVHVADWFAVFVEVATGRAAGFLENVGDLKAVDNPDAGAQRLPAPDAVNVWAGDITYTRARARSLSLSLSLFLYLQSMFGATSRQTDVRRLARVVLTCGSTPTSFHIGLHKRGCRRVATD